MTGMDLSTRWTNLTLDGVAVQADAVLGAPGQALPLVEGLLLRAALEFQTLFTPPGQRVRALLVFALFGATMLALEFRVEIAESPMQFTGVVLRIIHLLTMKDEFRLSVLAGLLFPKTSNLKVEL